MCWKSFENIIEPGSEEDRLLGQIDPESLPGHIAVIMDGNGRWAKARALPRIEGHKSGAESVQEITENSVRLGIKHLTLYAFSVENWNRPKAEVNELMKLLRQYIQKDLPTLMKHRIRFRAIGRIHELDFPTRQMIFQAQKMSAENDGLNLNIALNYSGRADLVDGMRQLGLKISEGTLDPNDIDEKTVSDSLYTSGIPDPDLLIRTSGEYRISNFQLWQLSYAEFHFTDVLWPDFRRKHLFQALIDFQNRHRRYGGL